MKNCASDSDPLCRRARWCVINPKTTRPIAFGIANVSNPNNPNCVVNCTEKNNPSPHIQDSATEFPQSTAPNHRGIFNAEENMRLRHP